MIERGPWPDAGTALNAIGRAIPLGDECRSCGASTYNHVMRISRWLKTGEACCPTFCKAIAMAAEGKIALSVAQREEQKT